MSDANSNAQPGTSPRKTIGAALGLVSNDVSKQLREAARATSPCSGPASTLNGLAAATAAERTQMLGRDPLSGLRNEDWASAKSRLGVDSTLMRQTKQLSGDGFAVKQVADITVADKMFDKNFLSCTATAKLMASQHMDTFSATHKLIGQNVSAGDRFLNQNFVGMTAFERVMGLDMAAINSVNKLNARMWGEGSVTAKLIEQQKQMLGGNAFNKMLNDDMFGQNSVHKLVKDNSLFIKMMEADFGVSTALRKGLERDIFNVSAFNKMVGVDPFAHTAFQKMANDISSVASVQKLMGSSAMMAALQHPPEWMTAKNAMFDIIETHRKHLELVKPMHDLLKLGSAASQFVNRNFGITYDAIEHFRDDTVFGTVDAAFSKPPAVEPPIRAPELDHFCSLHWFIGLGLNDLGEYLERTEQILSASAGQVPDSVIRLQTFLRKRYDECVRRHDRLNNVPIYRLREASPTAAVLIYALQEMPEELIQLAAMLDALWLDLV